MNKRFCKICGSSFEPKNARDRSKYCSPECRKVASQISYQKWKAKNPERYKEFQASQYKNRKRDGRIKIKNAYRGTPQPKNLHICQRCGCLTINYFNCPACTRIIMRDISQEYGAYLIKDGGAEDIESLR